MGTFTDNLLKLTEFPFSYSFISILAFWFLGQSFLADVEEGLLGKVGSLLILMSLVATTLAITDPVGRLQKLYLKGARLLRRISELKEEIKSNPSQIEAKEEKERERIRKEEEEKARRQADEARRQLAEMDKIRQKQGAPPGYRSWTRKREEARIERRYEEAKARIEREKDFEERRIEREKNKAKYDLCDQKIFGTSIGDSVEDLVKISLHKDFPRLLAKEWGKRNEKKDNEPPEGNKSPEPPKSVELDFKDRNHILHRIQILQNETAESTWVVREIDKITSLGYFIIVICTFFIAISFDSNFADNFLKGFQPSTTVADYQTASLATDNQTAAEENIIPRFIIASISGIFLVAVSIMLIFRLKDLNANALTAFKYRIMRDAIKIKRESFDPSLKEIEQYLNNGDWILAGDWTNKVMADYVELLKREWVGGITEEKVDNWEKEKFKQREEEK